MTTQTGTGSLEESRNWLKGSDLTCVVPLATSHNVSERAILDGIKAGVLDGIEQREWLFFDETVDVYAILAVRGHNQDELEPSLRSLTVQLDCQVTNGQPPDREGLPNTETIFRGEVEEVTKPMLLLRPGDESSSAACYIVWKVSIPLSRPRIRLHTPTVSFVASAALKLQSNNTSSRDGYLESGAPAGRNLLEVFSNDPALKGVQPRLSANRVISVAPVTQSSEPKQTLKANPTIPLPIYPAIHPRIRFARPNVTPPSAAVIAMLDIDFTPFFECAIDTDKIDLSMTDGKVENLNQIPGLELPLACVSHDNVNFMYRLTLHETDLPPTLANLVRDLDVVIECTALVEPGICTPKLRMAWSAPVDFTLPVNPGFPSSLSSKPFQRAHRPMQLSIGESGASLAAAAVARPDALPGLEAAGRPTSSTQTHVEEYGITMTFTLSTKGPIYPGDEFVWTVLVVNRSTSPVVASARSSTAQPTSSTSGPSNSAAPVIPLVGRKLALIALPKRRRNDTRATRPPSISQSRPRSRPDNPATNPASISPSKPQREEQRIADAILDENVIHAMQRSSIVDSTDVVCLSADVRVGPLAPNASHVAELRFLALKEGVVGMECVRVMDMGSQEHVDVRELPIMVVEGRPEWQ